MAGSHAGVWEVEAGKIPERRQRNREKPNFLQSMTIIYKKLDSVGD